MVFTMKFMQKIIVHNNTNHDLNNLILKHIGAGSSSSEIENLKPLKNDSVDLYTSRLIKDTDLILSCQWNGKNIESIVYNKLSSNDLRTISIFLTENDNKLKCNILVSNDVEI